MRVPDEAGRADLAAGTAEIHVRDPMVVDALTEVGCRVDRPKGTFYLFPRTPGGDEDDEAFARLLADQGNWSCRGRCSRRRGFSVSA